MAEFYQKHIFFCTNERKDGMRCCGGSKASKELYKYAKDKCRELKKLGKGGVGVSETRCLGRCNIGPTCVVYPQESWHTYTSTKDIDDILGF